MNHTFVFGFRWSESKNKGRSSRTAARSPFLLEGFGIRRNIPAKNIDLADWRIWSARSSGLYQLMAETQGRIRAATKAAWDSVAVSAAANVSGYRPPRQQMSAGTARRGSKCQRALPAVTSGSSAPLLRFFPGSRHRAEGGKSKRRRCRGRRWQDVRCRSRGGSRG